jgi:hypothetical protein
MLPSLNADGGSLSHVTNFPTSYIPAASVPIAVSAAGIVQLVAAVSGKAIYVIDRDVVAGGTGTLALEYGTGANSATGTTALTGNIPRNGSVRPGWRGPPLHSRRQRPPHRDY